MKPLEELIDMLRWTVPKVVTDEESRGNRMIVAEAMVSLLLVAMRDGLKRVFPKSDHFRIERILADMEELSSDYHGDASKYFSELN